MDQTTTRRLALIRYLYETGVRQSRAAPPLSSTSILLMHDAAELLLQLASEHLNAGARQPGFMDYWDLLEPALGRALAQKESMRRLNKARVAMKHHGTLPSELDIEAFRASVTVFFEDNTKAIFGLDLSDVSLVEYVSLRESREKLREAELLLDQGKLQEATVAIVSAYEVMIYDYESRKRSLGGRSPFHFGPDLTFYNSFFMDLNSGPLDDAGQKLGEFVDRVNDSLESMQNAIKVMALGLDYRKYSRFRRLTPPAQRNISGDIIVQHRSGQEDLTAEDVRFCIDFVVEAAIVLAEFDYTIERKDKPKSGKKVAPADPPSEGG